MPSLALATLAVALASAPTRAGSDYELNLGTLSPAGTPWRAMFERFEQEIEQGSGGRIDVIVRPGMMGEVEMVREVRRGERLQACGVSVGALAEGGNAPQLSLVELPYLFEDLAQADHVLDDVLFDPFAELLSRRGFVLALWSENGWRSFVTRGSPVLTPADLPKFKMRAQESPLHLQMYQQYGVAAVQKPMTEVLTSLQSDVIDGLDATALFVQTAGLAAAVDHFTVTNHIYQPSVVVFGKRWFDTLPADLQRLLLSKRGLGTANRAAIRQRDAEAISGLPQAGVQVHALTPAQREAFATIARRMHEPYAATIEGGPELLARIRAALVQAPK